MIESISIRNVASYTLTPATMTALSGVNYVFGPNGSGKTTIGRVIGGEEGTSECTLTWKGGIERQRIVYNRDFVERNFESSKQLPGVFTLGEDEIETRVKIATAQSDIDTLSSKIEGLRGELDGEDSKVGKKQALSDLEKSLQDEAWQVKKQFDNTTAQKALVGHLNSKESFWKKVRAEERTNKAELLTFVEIEEKAESILQGPPEVAIAIELIDYTSLVLSESNPILRKPVVGKQDIDIAAIIDRLGNSDWVQAGRRYFDPNTRVCPFCQQTVPESFTQDIAGYFDETFATDSRAIEALADHYKTESSRIQTALSGLINSGSKFLDIEALKANKGLLDNLIAINILRIESKQRAPSTVIALEPAEEIANALTNLVASANSRIEEHNRVVANISSERTKLTAQTWKYVVEQLRDKLSRFHSQSDGLEKAIDSINSKIAAFEAQIREKRKEIQRLEQLTTSVQPTIKGINDLLSSFGFQGFLLDTVDDGPHYRLVRPDNSGAWTSLSEGEKTFITFLYFIHLLKGSVSSNTIAENRVVVFDDPVSSLDSDILFIVSSLIKSLVSEVQSGSGVVKQVFVLTHNVYFYKEVTFPKRSKKKDKPLHKPTFWIVRKSNSGSIIEKSTEQSIKSGYELLWDEVKRTTKEPFRPPATIRNTLRRILETYFKILGGRDFDDLSSEFLDRDRPIYLSLISWIHDGSHSIHEDIFVTADGSSVESFLRVFRDVFDKTGQIAHYEMMMGDAGKEEQTDEFDAGIRAAT